MSCAQFVFLSPNGKNSRGILIFAYVHKKNTSNNLLMFFTLTFKCFHKFQQLVHVSHTHIQMLLQIPMM